MELKVIAMYKHLSVWWELWIMYDHGMYRCLRSRSSTQWSCSICPSSVTYLSSSSPGTSWTCTSRREPMTAVKTHAQPCSCTINTRSLRQGTRYPRCSANSTRQADTAIGRSQTHNCTNNNNNNNSFIHPVYSYIFYSLILTLKLFISGIASFLFSLFN